MTRFPTSCRKNGRGHGARVRKSCPGKKEFIVRIRTTDLRKVDDLNFWGNLLDNNLDLILSELTLRGQRLSLAESCTGGLLSGKLVGTSGVSAVYLGGVVAYSNEIKEKVLGVSPSLIKTLGAVSDATALAMARGVKRLTGSSWAVSITGIAGPNGGTDKKPVGTVWFAVVGPGIEVAEKKLFSGDRSQIQKQSVDFALDLLKRNIKRQRADAPLEE